MVKMFLSFTLLLLIVLGCGSESERGRPVQDSPDYAERCIVLHFNYSDDKGCQCPEINGDIFSTAFSEELMSRIQKAWRTKEPVVKMHLGGVFVRLVHRFTQRRRRRRQLSPLRRYCRRTNLLLLWQ